MKINKRFLRLTSLVLCAVILAGLGPLAVPADAKLFYGVTTMPKYIVQLVVGEDGYAGNSGTITVSYTDGSGKTGSVSADLFDGYLDLFPYRSLESNEPVLKIQSSERGYAMLANQVAMDYTGNFHNDVSRNLDPYSSYTVVLPNLPENLKSIDSVQLKLSRNDSLSLQSLRVIKVSSWPFHTTTDFLMSYMNGLYGSQMEGEWNGHLMAEASGSCKANSTTTFSGDDLTYYPEAERTWINNVRGTMQGVSVHIADIYDAGIEFLLAGYDKSAKTEVDSDDHFNAKDLLAKAGSQAYSAYSNLDPIVQDCLTLEVAYRDVLGDTRKIEIPFISAYLSTVLVDNAGVLSGKSYSTWISGIFQQNETVALPLPLAQYESLLGIKLTYGKTAAYSVDNDNVRTIPTDLDTLTVDNICFYEGVTFQNFKQPYDTSTLTCRLETELKPVYSYTAAGASGATLSTDHQLNVTLENGRLVTGAPKERKPENTYVFTLTNSSIEEAGTLSSVVVDITYVDVNGLEHTLKDQSLEKLVGQFYGYTFNFDVYEWKVRNVGMSNNPNQVDNRLRDLYQQYDSHMNTVGGNTQFAINVNNVAYFKSVTFHIGKTIEGNNFGTVSATKVDSWQLAGITVTKATDISQRYSTKKVSSGPYWMRDVEGDAVAWSNQKMLLQSGVLSQTVFLSYVDENGQVVNPGQTIRENEDYLDSLPMSMTYQEAMRELGLTVPKYTYQVSVSVGDLTDAGSTNHFYFQLIFQNGTSGVVLSNQQLSSDSFRQGCVETFQIQTTQNYGELKSVRIICDSASSISNVFDKLNISKIAVTMVGTTGVSRVWNIDNVGWININYTDEGEDYYSGNSEAIVPVETTNVQLVREYAVTGISTAVDLLFCISTAADSKLSLSGYNVTSLGTSQISATLFYLDSNGIRKEMNFDLINQLQNYNCTDELKWICRPNHMDRFVLSIPDVSSLISLELARADGKEPWLVSEVTVQQIGGLGTVYMSYNSEYIRETTNAMDLACNEQSGPFTVPGNSRCLISFTENSIVINKSDDDSWDATVTRVPDTTNDTLNVYLFSGKMSGKAYPFDEDTAIKGSVKYTTRYGGAMQTSFDFKQGTMDGQTVMYAEGINVSGMATLNAMSLKDRSGLSYATVVSHAVVQRVRGGVILDTYRLSYSNYLEFCSQSTPSDEVVSPMYQQVTLLSGAGQGSVNLTPETADVAVALRYTCLTSVDGPQKVYQSPYIYLTDQQITMLSSSQNVTLDFEVCNLKNIVGLSVISTGPVFRFEGASVRNFDSATNNLLSSAVAESGFSASAVEVKVPMSAGAVSTAVFSFVTPPDSEVGGAGTKGQVSMVIYYTNSQGQSLHVSVDDLISRLPQGETLAAGTTTQLSVLLPDAVSVEKVILYAVNDDWYLDTLGMVLTLSDGTVDSKALRVGNWVKTLTPLEVNMLVVQDAVLGMKVTGSSEKLGTTASSNGTGLLSMQARPGDRVTLRPEMLYSGTPDISCVWDLGQWEDYGERKLADTLIFNVPGDAVNGQSFIFEVSSAIEPSVKVSVVIKVTTGMVSNAGVKVMCVTEGTDVAVEGRPTDGAMVMAYPGDVITIQPTYNNGVQLASNWTWELGNAVGTTRVDGVGQLTWQPMEIPQVGDQLTVYVRHNETQARIGITVLFVADNSNKETDIYAKAQVNSSGATVTSDESHTMRVSVETGDFLYVTPYENDQVVSDDAWVWSVDGYLYRSAPDSEGRVKLSVISTAKIGDVATVRIVHVETGTVIQVIVTVVGKDPTENPFTMKVKVESSGMEYTANAGDVLNVDAYSTDYIEVLPYLNGQMQTADHWIWDHSSVEKYLTLTGDRLRLRFKDNITPGTVKTVTLTSKDTGATIVINITVREFDTEENALTVLGYCAGTKSEGTITGGQTLYLEAWWLDIISISPMVNGENTKDYDWVYTSDFMDNIGNQVSKNGVLDRLKLEYRDVKVGDVLTVTVTHAATDTVFTIVITIIPDD